MKIIAILGLFLSLNAFSQTITQADKDLASNMPEKGWSTLLVNKDGDVSIMKSSLKADKSFHSVISRSRFITTNHVVTNSEYVRLFISNQDCKNQKGKILIKDLVANDDTSQDFDLHQKIEGEDKVYQQIVKIMCKK